MKLSNRRMSRPSLGGMMATRQGAIILALVCALCATGILLFALGRYKATVKSPTAAAPPQATVLVATSQIAKGVSGDQIAAQSLYKSVPVAAAQVTPGAISDAAQLAGRQTTTTVLAGQQLTTADLSPQVRIVNALAPDQRAISVTLPTVNGSLPLLQTGDELDLYVQLNGPHGEYNVLVERGAPVLQSPTPLPGSLTTPTSTATPNTGTTTTGGAGTSTASSASAAPAANTGTTVVLGVTTSQVARVIYAAQNGQLYVALRPTKADRTPAVITNQASVLAGALSDTTTGARP